MENDLLTAADVARLAHVTPSAVRLWADAGRLPVVRTAGGIRLFRRDDVLHHLADRQEQAIAVRSRSRG